MIGRDGSVRVMDFGLARWRTSRSDGVEDASSRFAATPGDGDEDGGAGRHARVHGARAVPGRGAGRARRPVRFCVALYEALYGSRPVLAHVQAGRTAKAARLGARRMCRGGCGRRCRADWPLAESNVARRWRTSSARWSGDAAGPKRRALSAGAALAIALVAFGGWRVARGGHKLRRPGRSPRSRMVRTRRCAPPNDPPRLRRHRPRDRRDLVAARLARVRRLHRPVVGDVRRDLPSDARPWRAVGEVLDLRMSVSATISTRCGR